MNAIEYRIEIEPEMAPWVGSCSAIDAETDAAAETWIRDQIDAGNEWAWCSVTVVARWGDVEGEDHLGCCSYDNEEQFKQPGGYYDDMRQEAYRVLEDRLERSAAAYADLPEYGARMESRNTDTHLG